LFLLGELDGIAMITVTVDWDILFQSANGSVFCGFVKTYVREENVGSCFFASVTTVAAIRSSAGLPISQ
jgi:hypothetical protein